MSAQQSDRMLADSDQREARRDEKEDGDFSDAYTHSFRGSANSESYQVTAHPSTIVPGYRARATQRGS